MIALATRRTRAAAAARAGATLEEAAAEARNGLAGKIAHLGAPGAAVAAPVDDAGDDGWEAADATVADLVAKGAVRPKQPVKILGNGDIDVKVNVTADKFSGSAKSKIEAAGGSVTEA